MSKFVGLWLLVFAAIVSANAQLRPAANASTNAQPSIRSSANGTPVVEITTPDSHGVSKNLFDAFNVDKAGLVINNSFLPGHSALGGVVKHNPNLAWGDFARLIVDEVVGTTPSTLAGPLEIFGPRAGLVIANPNGIAVNGAQIHNISRLTLSTGTVQYDRNGNVGLSIDTGTLEIGSGGLHVLTVDDVTLLGRNIILDGPLEGGYLVSLFSGKRIFDYQTRTSRGTGAKGKGWGIDSNTLGGVSAGRIIIDSTDRGVGVRAPRHLAASAGDVTITANGRIRLGHIRSNGRIIVRSNGGNIVQKGNSVATGAIAYQATGKIENRGAISSGSDVELRSNVFANEGSILSNGAIWIYATGSADNSDQAPISASRANPDPFGTLSPASANTSAGNIALDSAGNQLLLTQGTDPALMLPDSQNGGYTYNAINPGLLLDRIAGTFAGGRYSEGVTQSGQLLYKAGDAANPGGSFFNFDPPTSIAQTRIDR